MGFYGCIGEQGHGRNEKQPKKKHKRSYRTYFVMHVRAKQKQEVGRDGLGGQRG